VPVRGKRTESLIIMANTKNLTPASRKKNKRVARRKLSKLQASMTQAERKEFRKEEKDSMKVFLKKKRSAVAKKLADGEKQEG